MILGDTGALVAFFHAEDADHRIVRSFFQTDPRVRELSIPAFVITETAYFIEKRMGARSEAALLAMAARGTFPIVDALARDYERASDLVLAYADFPLGAVDGLIVAMAERLNVTTLLTLDRRHFSAVRPAHREHFTIVP